MKLGGKWYTCPSCYSDCTQKEGPVGPGSLNWTCVYCGSLWSEMYLQAHWIGYRKGVSDTKALKNLTKETAIEKSSIS